MTHILQIIGAALGQANSRRFLAQMNHDAAAFSLDFSKALCSWLPAITACGAEHIACKAFRMDARQYALLAAWSHP
ncbi:MAG: hypothetical protein R3A44_17395 [Caldilineaceae bacterium]